MKKLFTLIVAGSLMVACSEDVITTRLDGGKQYISFNVKDGDAISGQAQNTSTRANAPWSSELMSQTVVETQVVEVETDLPTEEPLFLTITDEPFIRNTRDYVTRGALLNSGDASTLSFGVTEYPTGGTNIANVKWENRHPNYIEMISTNVALFIGPDTWEYDAYDNVQYDFYAYAPWQDAGAGQGITLSANRQAITYNPIGVAANNQPDLMTAQKVTSAYVGAIPLTFHHRLCAVQIKTGSTWPTGYKVSGIKFSNVIPSGTFNIDSDKDAAWSSYGSIADVVVTGVSAANSTNTEIAGDNSSNWVMMVPQTLSDAKLSVTLEDESHNTFTITLPLNNRTWRAGHTITYTVSLEGITSMSVSYPLGNRAWSGTENGLVTSYAASEQFGLFVVDKDGNVIVSNATATASTAGTDPVLTLPSMFYSKQYKYFLMYPKKTNDELSALLGANWSKLNGTSTNNATTADAFFSELITAWSPAGDQSDIDKWKAQDLQVGMFDGTKFPMAHKMGLANIKMAGAVAGTSKETLTLSANTTTVKYSNDVTDNSFYALDEFVTNLPYKVGDRNTAGLSCYFIVNPAKSYTFSTSYKYANGDSYSQWNSFVINSSNNTITNGSYREITTSVPKFKNFGRLYTYNGQYQTFTVLYPSNVCIYRMECWGAQGGNMVHTSYSGLGGLGGYVRGETIKGAANYLSANQALYVYCGGNGTGFSSGMGPYAGGWNGGGAVYGGASGGGGASDIRLARASATATVWNGAFDTRVIVAGGGGGSNDKTNGGYGGITGGTGGGGSSTNGNGGTQANGGTRFGTKGYCGYPGEVQEGSDGGGGGGGWYGGGRASDSGTAGGGGSSYISGYTTGGCSTNASLAFYNSTAVAINGGSVMPDPNQNFGTNKAAGYSATNSQHNDTGTDRGFVRITCMPYNNN